MGRWHREGYKYLRHLAERVLLTSVLLCDFFWGASVRCDAKAENRQDTEQNIGQSTEQNVGQESVRSEGSTTVTAYVSTEPETPADHPDDSDAPRNPDTDGGKDTDNPDQGGNSENSGRNAKTGDRTEIDYLIYIVMGSFINMISGIIILYVDNFKKKEDEC